MGAGFGVGVRIFGGQKLARRAAHRRLIASVHPDKGGTEALAAQINAARDLLLQERKRR